MAPVDPEMASALHQEIRSHGVDLRLRTALTEVLRTETGFRVALSEGGFLQTDMVILAIGVKPGEQPCHREPGSQWVNGEA